MPSPSHRMPPALVPYSSTWLSWAAGKDTGRKIRKGWGFGGEIFAASSYHPQSLQKVSVMLSPPPPPSSLRCRRVAEPCMCIQSTLIIGVEVQYEGVGAWVSHLSQALWASDFREAFFLAVTAAGGILLWPPGTLRLPQAQLSGIAIGASKQQLRKNSEMLCHPQGR